MQERATLERQIARKRWLISRRAHLADALDATPPLHELRELTVEAEGLGFGDLTDVAAARVRGDAADAWGVRVDEKLESREEVEMIAEIDPRSSPRSTRDFRRDRPEIIAEIARARGSWRRALYPFGIGGGIFTLISFVIN